MDGARREDTFDPDSVVTAWSFCSSSLASPDCLPTPALVERDPQGLSGLVSWVTSRTGRWNGAGDRAIG